MLRCWNICLLQSSVTIKFWQETAAYLPVGQVEVSRNLQNSNIQAYIKTALLNNSHSFYFNQRQWHVQNFLFSHVPIVVSIIAKF